PIWGCPAPTCARLSAPAWRSCATSWAKRALLALEVEVDQQGGVVGRSLALAGEAVDERERRPLGQRFGGQHQVDAQAPMLVEVAGPVVPPGVQTVVDVEAAKHVDQAPLLEGGDRLALGRAHVGAAVKLGGIPDVAV